MEPITHDLDFADIRTFPPAEYQGLIVLRPSTQHILAIVRLAQYVMALLASEPLTGRLWVVEKKSDTHPGLNQSPVGEKAN